MNTKKNVLGILALVIVFGLGFFVAKNNKNTEQKTSPVEPPVTTTETKPKSFTEFGKIVTFKIGDKVVFSDGLNVVLKQINDSRCPEGAQCFWAGELAGVFELSGGKLIAPKEISLGTVNNKNVSSGSYTFSLQDATENSITMKVTKN